MATAGEGRSDVGHEGESARTDGQSSSSSIERVLESNWDNFSRWISAICVVTFDLELGQAMEVSCRPVVVIVFLSL